jgi:hypothetical protein
MKKLLALWVAAACMAASAHADIRSIVNPGEGSDDPPPSVTAPLGTRTLTTERFGGPTATADAARLDIERPSTVRFWRKGFNEVVVLVYQQRAVCTATIVSDGHVITAAHCVTVPRYDAATRRKFADVIPANQFKVVFPQVGGEYCYSLSGLNGSPAAQKCGVEKREITAVKVQESYLQRPDSLGSDLAVLTFDGGLPPNIPTAKLVAPWEGGGPPLTISGFGFSNAGDGTAGGTLQVGWREQYTFNLPSNLLQWDMASGALASSSCLFDSGGPVFRGFRQGRLGEDRQLVGVIVGLTRTDVQPNVTRNNAEALCTGGIAVNSLPFSSEAKAWVCSAVAGRNSGC